ncbi:hypothetical protein [Streptomyces lavendulae]|uniref:hypothetical protein n=1 Tax=Streptomyces lavendulae TaxID=1914 RepID=UPI0033DE086A
MVEPIPMHLSPEQLERLKELIDAARLRAVLFVSPPLSPVQRSTPQGRPHSERTADRGRQR